jgi:hypothetical protein
MPVHVDELTTRVDVVPGGQSGGGVGAPPAEATQVAQQIRAALARLAALDARTRAERHDD